MDKIDQFTILGASSGWISTTKQSSRRKMNWTRTSLITGIVVITILLSACSSATSTVNPAATQPVANALVQTAAPTEANTQPPTSTPQDTAMPPAATSVPQQAATTQLDPCTLISSQEASTLTGASFGNGKEGTTPGGMKMCTYASQTKNVLVVSVIQAPDVETAKADEAQFLADIQANLQQLTNEGMNVTEVPNFADGAVSAEASVNAGGITFNGSAFGFLKGTIFFGFSDIDYGGTTPNSAAMQSEATTVLGKLP